MASTYLTRTPSGAGNRKKWTWSAWVKKHQESSSSTYNTPLFGTAGGSYDTISFLTTPNSPKLFMNIAGSFERQTNALFRDCFGWYHIVVTFDSNQSTATDRLKVYINGVQQSSFSDNTNGSQDADSNINKAEAHQIGKQQTLSRYGDFSMTHVHFCDGYAYAASDFGSTDSVTGEWSINTSPSVSYGTNGFFILKDGNSLTDQSPNTNNWSLGGGTLTKTEDNPSNVFATLNPLFTSSNTINFTNGNTIATGVNYQNQRTGGTLASSSGKFYFESKVTGNAGFGGSIIGIADYDNANITNSNTWFGSENNFVGFYSSGRLRFAGSGAYNDYGTVNVNDIIGFAFDIDNGFAYISRNGTWLNSGDPTSGSTGTGNVNRTGNLNYNFSEKLMGIAGGFQVTDAWTSNFGNGYFGTTAVSSAGTNASGNGIFEYDVPTGFTALSTKGLNL